MTNVEEGDNLDKIFKGQHSNEEFVCFFRHHWIVLVKDFMIFGALLIVIVISLINFNTIREEIVSSQPARMIFVICYIAMTILLHRFFIRMLNYFVNIGIITNMRIIDHQKTIFFKDIADSIDLNYIQNIEQISEGLLASIFNYGSIKIFLASSVTTKIFPNVTNAKYHFRCLSRQKEIREENIAQSHQQISHEEIENEDLHTSG